MNKYRVAIREIHECEYFVDADSPEEAIDLAFDGEGEIGETEFITQTDEARCYLDGKLVLTQD